MADKLKDIQAKVMEWWNRFTSKQKTIIIGITAVVIFTFAILIYTLSKPQYTKLYVAENTAEAAEIIAVLDTENIQYQTSNDGLRIDVVTSQLSTANLALGAAGFSSEDYSIEDATSGGFSVTESDKQKRYVKYLEQKLARDLESLSAVKSATVHLTIPAQDGTMLAKAEDSSAFVKLELADDFTEANARTVARAVATALGNSNTANITLVDTNANMLFYGGEDNSGMGVASSILELRNQAINYVGNQVKTLLLGSGMVDNVVVSPHLDIDYSEYQKTVHKYAPYEDRDEGLISHQEEYNEESSGGTGGAPGTDSNDGEGGGSYMYGNGSNSSQEIRESIKDHLYDEEIESSVTPAGGIKYGTSSLSATLLRYKTIREEDAKAQGLLDGITWREFQAANDAVVKLEVDPDLIAHIANATGISEERIALMSYEKTLYVDKDSLDITVTDIMSAVVFVIILALLAFVVISSMRSRKVVEEEEELSVENLLQSAPEVELEDFDLEAKSETRKMIEKFVDENPEAVANLLRNWLTEDWG